MIGGVDYNNINNVLHMGNNSQQIASHRQTHTYRAVPSNILRKGGPSFRVTTPSRIPVVALKKIIKNYSPANGKKFFVLSQDYQSNIPNHGKLRV